MANNYSLFNPAPMQADGLLLPETPQEQNLKRQQRIAEYEQREMVRKQKEQAIIEEAKKMWQSLNPAQKIGMSPFGFPFTDAIGLAGDVQMYKKNPEMRSAGNYAMSGVGLLPFVPGVASTVMKKGKTLYHGSAKPITDLKKGKNLYMTENPDYANRYTDPGYSAFVKSKESFENLSPSMMKAEVDTSQLFDTRNPAHRKVFEEQFLGKRGNNTPLTEKGLPDWSDAEELTEFIEEKKLPFKGVMVDEGGSYDELGNVVDRGIGYVISDPEIVKPFGKK